MRGLAGALGLSDRARWAVLVVVLTSNAALIAFGLSADDTEWPLIVFGVFGLASATGLVGKAAVWAGALLGARYDTHLKSATAVAAGSFDDVVSAVRSALGRIGSEAVHEHRDHEGTVLWTRTPPVEHFFGQLVSVTLKPLSDREVELFVESSLSEPALRDFGRNAGNVEVIVRATLDALGHR